MNKKMGRENSSHTKKITTMRAGRFPPVSSFQVPLAFVGRASPFLGLRTSSSGIFCRASPFLGLRTSSSVTKTPEPVSQFPYGDGSFCSVFSSTGTFWYVDKTDYIPQLEALKAKTIVSLRPRRMGKTLWKDTLANYYDAAQKGKFAELFGHLEIGKAPTALANTFFVLPLTFAGLKTDTVEEFKASLNDHLNTKAVSFKEKYNLSFTPNGQNALDTFERLVEEMKRRKEKLYVIIDEYDVSINKALGKRDFVSALQVSEAGRHRNPLQRMENIYAEFFSKVKTACDDNVAQCFITGVTPLALTEFTSGFNIATHITNDLRFASLYGFTEADLKNGLARLKFSETVAASIVEFWRKDHNGYYFNPRQKVALYNPTRVIHGLRYLEQVLQVDPPPPTLQPEEVITHLLSRIPDDNNSLPSEATLRAISSNPNASLVIADALSSDTPELDCEGGVKGQFRLSHMNELATDRKPLLSFMFYTGALTYVPSNAVKLKYALRIPNNVARMEFAEELKQMIGLKEGGIDSLREAIITMLDTKKIDSFCKAVSKYLLAGLDGRDVVGGEDPFSQAVFDALALARRPTDSVHKEFKVDPVARAKKVTGFALDVVYISSSTSVKQYYCLSLKNIPVQGLELAKTAGGRFEETTWEKLCEISRLELDDETQVSDDNILALPLNVGFMKQHKKGDTVKIVLDKAVEEAKSKYLPPLQGELGPTNVHCWALVKVGLRRIIWKKVNPV
jgi:hypothetical protein